MLPDALPTRRLRLRPPARDDAAVIHASYGCDPEVARYMVWRPHTALAQTVQFIDECIAAWTGTVRRPYVITLAGQPDAAIGMIEARVHAHAVDMGYVLARAHWGQGLMPEAVDALTQALLATPDCFRVQATCDAQNRPSARTLEKAGFALEGRLGRFTVHPNLGPEPRDCLLYARCR